MQGPFRPPDENSGRSAVVSRKRRILGLACHGHGIEKPVNFEAEGIKRVLRNLPRDIDEQSVINIESLAGKRQQAGEHGSGKKYVMKVLVVNAVDKR